MKKGFTLIEMLGIITVLAIILIVTFPALNKTLKQMKINNEKGIENNLKISAEAYVELNREKYPQLKTPNNGIEITIKELYDANLLKGNDEELNMNDTIVVISTEDKTLRYFYKGEEIGILNQTNSDDKIVLEAALIKNNINQNTIDGIYYYNNSGNLENGENSININNNLNNIKGNILIHNHQLISGCIQYNNKNYDYYKGTITEQQYPCSTTRGENLVINGDLSYHDNTNFSRFTYVAEEGTNGYLSRTSNAVTTDISNLYIPIDIYNKSYEMGMTARSNQSEAKYYIGFRSYDIDKQEISPAHIMYISNTLTTLARDLNDGDEYIYITDLTNWNKNADQYKRAFIFWNYKDSTGYEYPELTYSRNISGSDAYSNENIDTVNNRIKLNAPWDKGYIKAGTKMSQRSSGNVFIYNLKLLGTLQTSWENLSKTQSGTSYTGDASGFWHGTRYIRFAWYNNYQNTPNTTTDFKDIYIREVIE